MSDKLEKTKGHLRGLRCPECGCCTFVNALGDVWCSECDWTGDNYDYDGPLKFVPIPQSVIEKWYDRINEDPR